MVVVYPAEKESQFRGVPWEEVFSLMKVRFAWENDVDLSLHAFSCSQAMDTQQKTLASDFRAACEESDVFFAVDMQDDLSTSVVKAAQSFKWPAFIVLDSPAVRSSRSSAPQCSLCRLGSSSASRWPNAHGGKAHNPPRDALITWTRNTRHWTARMTTI